MDAIISDIVVIVDKAWEEKLKEAEQTLKDAGMTIRESDDDNSVITGLIEESKVHALEKLPCVDYVRKVFTYYADYPPGDPRDVDKM